MLGLPGCAERGGDARRWDARPPAGCTALHGLPETKERRPDRQTHTRPSASLPAASPPAARDGTGREEGTSIPREEEGTEQTLGFQAMPPLWQSRHWDKMGYEVTRLAELLPFFARSCRTISSPVPNIPTRFWGFTIKYPPCSEKCFTPVNRGPVLDPKVTIRASA